MQLILSIRAYPIPFYLPYLTLPYLTLPYWRPVLHHGRKI